MNLGALDPITSTQIQLEAIAAAVGGSHRAVDAASQLRALEMQTEILAARQLLSGRTEQQQLLWRLLMRLGRRPKTHVAVVTGPAGVGKTALCRWLCQSMDEHGPLRTFRLPIVGDLVAATRDAVEPWLRLSDALEPESLRGWLSDEAGLPAALGDQLAALFGDAELEADDIAELWTNLLAYAQATPTHRPLLLWMDGPADPAIMTVVEALASSGLHMLLLWSTDLPEELAPDDLRARVVRSPSCGSATSTSRGPPASPAS